MLLVLLGASAVILLLHLGLGHMLLLLVSEVMLLPRQVSVDTLLSTLVVVLLLLSDRVETTLLPHLGLVAMRLAVAMHLLVAIHHLLVTMLPAMHLV